MALVPLAPSADEHGTDLPRQFDGRTHSDYANMVGPFGGVTAAQALQAVLQHPQRLGEPISLTVNFAAGLVDGPFRVEARPMRTNRSTQHWAVTLWQTGANGVDAVMLTATAVTAVRRSTWSAVDEPMPAALPPSSVASQPLMDRVRWVNRYDMRLVAGSIPKHWDDAEADSLTQLWLRDNPPRVLDYASLTALADAFFPRIWQRRARMTPIGTVSLTVYYHAGLEELAATGDGFLFGQARSQSFFNGFFDQSAQLWSEAGHLLATTHQIVYYKE
nr:thioesterase family protein [Ottowia thiooxydans]